MKTLLLESTRFATFAGAVCIAWVAATAHAAPPAPSASPSASASAQAAAPKDDVDRWFEEGVAAQKAGKLAEAEALFQKAWAVRKTWDIAGNLGMVEFKLGKLVEGAELVAFALANLPPSEGASTRDSLKNALDAARPEIGEIAVTCDVEGA